MLENEKKTALISSAATDVGQSDKETITTTITDLTQKDNPKVMGAVTMNELLDQTFQPRPPIIEGLLYCGTYIFVGPPKIGKSFLMAQIAFHVAKGLELWECPVRKGAVLYLALEDDYARLQGRLSKMFAEEGTDNLFLTIKAQTLANGLISEMEKFLKEHPETNLIIVDTLQKIRELQGEQYSYGSDYEVISQLKRFSDKHRICILVVHHTRKMEARDSFEMISGTNGIFGSADGAFVLQKKTRTDPQAELEITGRDQPDAKLKLKFDQEKCLWLLEEREGTVREKIADPVLVLISELVNKEQWTGSPSELFEQIHTTFKQPNALTRHLNAKVNELYQEYGIQYEQERTHEGRKIHLIFVGETG